MPRVHLSFALLWVWIFLPLSALAGVTEGANWLATQQNLDGSFGNTATSLATPVQTTTEALRAYQALGQQTPSVYVPALGYLNSDTEANTEFLARKILVNVPAGGDVTTLVNALAAHQNADGGFGDNSGQSSSVFDTAFALQAFAAAGYRSSQQVAGAVGFLMNRQSAAGGWADGGNVESVHLTALAMRSLWFSRYTYIGVQDALTRAQTFMLSQRDAAGLWGETFDSALSLIALVQYLPDLTPVTSSIASLRAGQSANGSWNNDPYTTALALRAISLADAPQSNPDYVTIQGKVLDAQTGLPLSGVTVTLAGSVSRTFTTISGGVFLFRSLPAGSYTVQLALASYGTLSTITSGQLGQTLDLGSLSLAKSLGTTTGTIQGVVTDVATGAPLAGVSVTATGVATPVLTDAAGRYQLNNIAPGLVTVSASLTGYATASGSANLTAGGIMIFSPSLNLGAAQGATLSGTVTSGVTGAPLSGVTISVSGAATASAVTDASGNYQITGLSSGTVMLLAVLGGLDTVTSGAAISQNANVRFSPKLYPSGTTPPNANTAGVTGLVLDAGSNAPLPGAIITAVFGAVTQTLTSDAAGRFTVTGLTAPQGTLHVAVAGYVSADLGIALDPLTILDIGQVRLRKTQASVLLPDLTVTAVDRIAAITDPRTLILSGIVAATISNRGTSNGPANVQVLAFYDANNNRVFDQGDTTLGQIATTSELAVGATTTVSIPVQGTLPFRDAPIRVWVDSTQVVVESNETNNSDTTSSACEVRPSIGTFQPVLKWAWTGSGSILPAYNQVMTAPVVAQTNDDNGDGRIDGNDIPDIIFIAYTGTGGVFTSTSVDFSPGGILRIISGKDGSDLVATTDTAYRFIPTGNLAVADIDGDGLIDVIGPRLGGGLIAFEHNGQLKWELPLPKWNNGGPAIVDMDNDGTPEIILGNQVINANGTLRWTGVGGFTAGGIPQDRRGGNGSLSIAADIDNSGHPSLIVGASAYRYNGELLWRNDLVGDGFAAIGNFNGDSFPEIVVVSVNLVSLLDHNGALIWGPVQIPGGGGGGGPPIIADMDGDGQPEIGVAGATAYSVFKADGSVLWSKPTRDISSSVTGSTVFDFNGDGEAEVIYADEYILHIFRGKDGAVLFEIPNSNGTVFEFPVVADVDNDNHADLVVVANQHLQMVGAAPGPGNTGIRVFEGANNSWVNTRKIWNQHSYHITNINDDGSVPAVEQNSWQTHNTYRLNAFLDRSATGVPDLTASLLSLLDNGTGLPLSLSLRVGNGGTAPSPSAVKTAFYQGDPAAGGVLLGTVTLPVIAAAGYQDIRLDNVSLNGSADVYAVVDSTNLVTECNKTNNVDRTAVAAATNLGRITVSTDNLVYGPNATVRITPVVWNIGALPGSYNTVLQIEDTNGVVVTALPAGSAGPVNGGAMLSMASAWNVGTTLAGNYSVHAFLYAPAGGLLDQATASFTIRQPGTAGPIASLRVTTDRPVYYTTDLVNIDSLVANLSVSTLIGSSNLRITVTDPSGQVVFTNTGILGQLLPNSLRELIFPYALKGAAAAVYRVHGEILDGTSALLASADTQFEVRFDLAKALTGKVAAALPSLEIGTAQTCTDTLTNQGTVAATGIEVHHALLNLDTQQLVNDQTVTLTLAPGESNQAARSLATGSLTAGHYACALMVRFGNDLKTLAFAPFEVKVPPIRIDASLGLGTKGRLLVLLDNGRRGEDGDHASDDHKNDKPNCDGVKQLSLSATFGAPLSNAATVTARVTGQDGVFVDAESASVAGFPGALNLSAGSNGADLVLSRLTAQGIELILQPLGGSQKLGNEYSVEVIVQDGNTLRLTSGTIRTDCNTPLDPGQTIGSFTLSGLDVVPAANDANYRDGDPYGPATAPGLKAQRTFLETLLKAKGWSYTITDTSEDFTKELRAGGYTVYAVFAEQEKLEEQVQKELREAVFRGEGLVVAGIHDARNQKLLDALGIKLIGSVLANGVDLTTSSLGVTGHINLIAGDKALRMKRVHAETAGLYTLSAPPGRTDLDDCHDQGVRYDTTTSTDSAGKDHRDDDECGGHPERYLDAVTTNSYGKGQSVFTGFDLLATATRDGQDSLAATLLTKALERVHPAELPRGPGAVVPLTLTLTNRGIATPATATISLPAGTTVVDPGTGTAGANTLVFNVNLVLGQQQHLTFWVKLPQLAGPVTFQAVVTAPKLAKPAATVSYTVTVLQPESLTSIDDRLTQLINSSAPNSSALRRAEGYVAKGLKNIFPAKAIEELLKATDALLGIDDPAVTDIRVAIDIWIRWAAQYAY